MSQDLKKILDVTQNSIICNRRDFTKKIGKKKREPIVQELKKLTQHEFNSLEPVIQKYFYMVEETLQWGGTRKVYELMQPWRFELVVKRNLITHVASMGSSEAESERDYLMKKLYYQDKLAYKYLDGQSDTDNYLSYKRSEVKKETKKIIDEELN